MDEEEKMRVEYETSSSAATKKRLPAIPDGPPQKQALKQHQLETLETDVGTIYKRSFMGSRTHANFFKGSKKASPAPLPPPSHS